MAYSDFYTMTPGSAVADKLTEILTKRKEEQRQAMIDALNKQNLEHGWANQDATLSLQRDQEARLGRGQDHDDMVSDVGLMPDVADPSSFDPKHHDYLKGIGRIQTRPGLTPSVSSSYGAAGGDVVDEGATVGQKEPDREVYLGSNKYEEGERQKADIGELVGNPDFKNLPSLQQALIGAQHGVNIPGEALGKPGRLRVVTPDNAASMNGTEWNPHDHAIEQGYPPNGPQTNIQWIGNDEFGKPLSSANRLDAMGKPVFLRSDGSRYEGPISPKPAAGSQAVSKVNPTLRNAYTMARNGGTSAAARQRQLAAANQIISSYPTTPDVKRIVAQVLQNPGVADTIEDVIEQVQSRSGVAIPQDKAAAISDLLLTLGMPSRAPEGNNGQQ